MISNSDVNISPEPPALDGNAPPPIGKRAGSTSAASRGGVSQLGEPARHSEPV